MAKRLSNSIAALALAFSSLIFVIPAEANCAYPGQEAAIAAAQQAETSSPVVTVIEACGGDDTSYQIPLSVDVTFDGQVFKDVYVTTNSVITFGRPDGTFWDYPETPSISLYSTDWVIYPNAREDEHLIISTSDGGFQVDISARPIWLQSPQVETTNITITAAILSDGTVAMAYTVEGPTYDNQTRTGVRLNDGSIVSLEDYGIERLSESPTLSPEPASESPFVPEQPTASPEPEPTESPATELPVTESPEPTESPVAPPTSSESPSPEPEQPVAVAPFVPNGATVYSEGQVAEIIAPQGQRIASILGYYGDPNDSRNGQDVSPTLAQFAGSQSAIIQANNELFGDPAPGIVKIMILLVNYEAIPLPPGPTPEELEAARVAAEQAAQAAAAEAARLEAERVAAEAARAEAARIAAEQAAAAEAARLEAERLEAARIEAERIAALEQAERERLQRLAEEAEQARIEAERIAAEQAAELARIEAERAAAEEAAEAARLEAERIEAQRIAAEAAAAAEAARLEAERLEAERIAAEKAAEEARLEAERIAAEKAAAEEAARLEALEKARAEEEARLEAERIAAEKAAKEEAERIAAELEKSKNDGKPEAEVTEVPAEEPAENEQQPLPEPESPSAPEEPATGPVEETNNGIIEEVNTVEELATEAQADDPEVPEELAAIPLIGDVAGAVLEVFNDLGNVGADMTPEVREKSEKVVVASVIVGQIAQVASAAAASAASAATRKVR